MEAFVYCWTDNKTNMLYIGSHKGTENDGYVCSSKIMLEEYNKRPHDFTRKILAKGSFEEIRKLEATLLNDINVKDNDLYYNMHNGNGDFYLKKHTEKYKKYMSELMKNRKISEETKQKMRDNHADVSGDKNPMYGKKHRDEVIQKMSVIKTGKKDSEYTKKKKSAARLGEKNPMFGKKRPDLSLRNKTNPPTKGKKIKSRIKVECNVCKKICDASNAARWHFENCKGNKI